MYGGEDECDHSLNATNRLQRELVRFVVDMPTSLMGMTPRSAQAPDIETGLDKGEGERSIDESPANCACGLKIPNKK